MTRKIKRTARQIGFSGGTAVFSLLFFFFALSCLLCAAPQAAVSILNGKRTGLLLLKLSLCIFSAFAVFSVRAAVKNGAVYFFLKKARGLEASVKDVFCFFQKDAFFSSLAFEARLLSLQGVSAAVCFSPFVAAALFLWYNIWNVTSVLSAKILLGASAAVFVCCAFFYLRLKRTLFLSRYLFASGEAEAEDCFKASVNRMKKNTGGLLRLRLSFCAAAAGCALILPCAAFWSYYSLAQAVFAAGIIFEREQTENEKT